MKKFTAATTFFLVSTLATSLTNAGNPTVDFVFQNKNLITCVSWPWCGGPDFLGPLTTPKDTKTETQDAKDEKLA